MPARPVAQLAFPELTTTARTRPPVESNDARPTSTGAATTRFVVNNAAALAPFALQPAPGPAATHFNSRRRGKEKPRGKRIFSENGAVVSCLIFNQFLGGGKIANVGRFPRIIPPRRSDTVWALVTVFVDLVRKSW